MPTFIQASVVRVVCHAVNQGQQQINVWDYAGVDEVVWAGADPEMLDLLTAIKDRIIVDLIPLQSIQVQYLRLVAGRINGYTIVGTMPRVTYFSTAELTITDVVGQATSAPLLSYTAVSGQKKTARPGRRYSGASRLGGVLELDTDTGTSGNFLTAAVRANWQAAWDHFAKASFTPTGAAGRLVRMGVFSLTDMVAGNPVGPVAPAPYFARNTNTPINLHVGSQVSRKYGHGA